MGILSGLPKRVRVYEVGPRDGLQNEKGAVATADKIRYIDLLSAAGLPDVEATSFVSPRAVPQLADAAEVMAGISRRPGTRYPVLVPNERGMARTLEAGVDAIAVFTAATEGFTRANIRMSIDESIAAFRPVVRMAREAGCWVRGYISTAFGCPYEGEVQPEAVVRVVDCLLELGVDEISIGDTIGVGTPDGVERLLMALDGRLPLERQALHFHDTRGTALANVMVALQLGVSSFDSSSAGLGGCPYAPGATGNLATEDLLYLLHRLGIETGVDAERVAEASRFILGRLGRAPASKVLQATAGPP